MEIDEFDSLCPYKEVFNESNNWCPVKKLSFFPDTSGIK